MCRFLNSALGFVKRSGLPFLFFSFFGPTLVSTLRSSKLSVVKSFGLATTTIPSQCHITYNLPDPHYPPCHHPRHIKLQQRTKRPFTISFIQQITRPSFMEILGLSRQVLALTSPAGKKSLKRTTVQTAKKIYWRIIVRWFNTRFFGIKVEN